jgi:hypothetical protein
VQNQFCKKKKGGSVGPVLQEDHIRIHREKSLNIGLYDSGERCDLWVSC